MEVRHSSYMQNLFLDPIALHFLNLETSAARLYLCGFRYPFFQDSYPGMDDHKPYTMFGTCIVRHFFAVCDRLRHFFPVRRNGDRRSKGLGVGLSIRTLGQKASLWKSRTGQVTYCQCKSSWMLGSIRIFGSITFEDVRMVLKGYERLERPFHKM